jgi:hypothetical protein
MQKLLSPHCNSAFITFLFNNRQITKQHTPITNNQLLNKAFYNNTTQKRSQQDAPTFGIYAISGHFVN